MFSKQYFRVQKIVFTGLGIDATVKDSKYLIKRPVLLYGLILLSFFHFIIVTHYIWINSGDFVEVTDSMPMLCQLILSIWKMTIFLYKRQEILQLINEIHAINLNAKPDEVFLVRRENSKDNFLCNLYLRLVTITGSFAVTHPVMYAIYMYGSRGVVILNEANKASYFWDYSHLSGYSLVFMLNGFTVYFVCVVSLALDSLFSWFVSNISAQFHILSHRFENLALNYSDTTITQDQQIFLKSLVSCIKYHRQTLQLAETLNQVYGEIIFIKCTIVCIEICSLVFRASRPHDSLAEAAYKSLFLCAVALQLILYCYNGQRIKDESFQVTDAIYCAFDWSSLTKSSKGMLFVTMIRSQKSSNVRGVFFEVDLSLFLWVFKTAGSLITALKTLDENQD
ncbi:odorant receptor 45a-like [Lucilia sericata]|uniref:odorant receptor 45a-like n=1 Tax=Lucilia sericata TaxID=13632 RepID=UPI0018A7FE31|nr:odorant receptor 45a-like [Lucilia sericata]